MKIAIFSILLISSNISFAQNGMILSRADFAEGSTFSRLITSKNSGRALNYDEIVGSPYLNVNFSMANVAYNYEKIPVRYNSYTDQIEFQKDEKVMVLPNESKFQRIEIISPRQTLIFLETNDNLSGYFFELYNGKNVSLYKKVQTKFIDVIPASNTYSSDKPAMFKTQDPIFYIKTENGYIKKPKNIKDIIEEFPAKKQQLNTFFKENKIKFHNEDELKKLMKFLDN
ncbi:hypothetical protein [Chryseobacterium echinoideorum]|uniref:hypothetical protein n=1 Tax=Chryseobacterium echinoideorum TaxID=1549648 RepID=UPI001185B7F6|nr:hypothetical protein [Chryseobacterium echinoideorum]